MKTNKRTIIKYIKKVKEKWLEEGVKEIKDISYLYPYLLESMIEVIKEDLGDRVSKEVIIEAISEWEEFIRKKQLSHICKVYINALLKRR